MSSPPTSPVRLRIALPALGLLAMAAVTACSSSDDNKSDPKPSPSSSSAAPTTASASQSTVAQPEIRDCTTTLTVTGAAAASYNGSGTATLAGSPDAPPAVYQLVSADTSLTLYAAGGRFKPTVLLTAGSDTYGLQRAGLQIRADGSAASIDLDLQSPQKPGSSAHVKASFTCS